jgi:RNA polymerase sigma-70 factor (ECF subfamily)
VAGYQRRQRRTPQSQPLPAEAPQLAVVEPPSATADKEYQDLWRDELLAKVWEELHAFEKQTGQPCYTMLLLRSEEPDLTSDHMAERLSPRLGRPLTAAGVRQTLHRARVKFADLLVAEVGRSLETAAPDRIEQELIDLDLLPYCRAALDRRTQGS